MRDVPSELNLGDEVRIPVSARSPSGVIEATLYGRRLGAADQRVKILLLHGVGLTWVTWRRVLPLLEPLGEVLAVDLVGFGRSVRRRGVRVSIEEQTRLIADLLDQLGWHETIVVGHSMGGGIALGTTLHQPRRVKGLVLVSSVAYAQDVPLFFYPLKLPGFAPLLTLGARVGNRFRLPWFMTRYYGYDPLAATDFLHCLEDYQVSRSFCEAVRSLRPERFERYAAFYPTIRKPVLLLHGARDDIVPGHVPRRLDSVLPNSELVWLPRGHHIMQETHPREVADAITAYVTGRLGMEPQ